MTPKASRGLSSSGNHLHSHRCPYNPSRSSSSRSNSSIGSSGMPLLPNRQCKGTRGMPLLPSREYNITRDRPLVTTSSTMPITILFSGGLFLRQQHFRTINSRGRSMLTTQPGWPQGQANDSLHLYRELRWHHNGHPII
ncbi:unnamed protein product [Meganyctiphanes norvegica]|uniref:Uncharacterized protein n=1 Tax=Meganyctiphanes norvegica TaxID=48144 RepID=A0AAV2QJ84_MEGNR